MTLVRHARPGDGDALYDLLMELDLENNSFEIELDYNRIRQHIAIGMHGVIDAPDVPGKIAASAGIIFNREWFAKPWHLQMIWFFVRPEYRHPSLKPSYADELMAWAKKFRHDFSERVGHDVPLIDAPFSRTRLKAKLRWWGKHSEMIGGIFLIR